MNPVPGVVEIPQIGFYVKTPEALEVLLQQLKVDGYDIKDCGKDEHHSAPGSWFASLRDDVYERKGKCGSCGSYIDVTGIWSHHHKCEVCGAYTYDEFPKGSTVRFVFANDPQRPDYEPTIMMRVFGFDERMGRLLLYVNPLNGNNFNDCSREMALRVLGRNQSRFSVVKPRLSKGMRKHIRLLKAQGKTREVSAILSRPENRGLGKILVAIPYDPHSCYITETSVINLCDILWPKHNGEVVKLYKGKEYKEWEKLPVSESFMIYETWRWAPLQPSPVMHEKIIRAAGMVSDCGYYHQDGSRAFYDIHLERMRLFVEHFTELPLELWDQMIRRAPKDGPGMIMAIADFCEQSTGAERQIENRPNVGNLIEGFAKIVSGKSLSPWEKAQFDHSMEDPEEGGKFVELCEALAHRGTRR